MCQALKKWISIGVYCCICLLTVTPLNGDSYKPKQTFTSDLPGFDRFGPNFGNGFGTVASLHPTKNFLFISASLTAPENRIIPGAVLVYKKRGSEWENIQIIETLGTGDHLGSITLQAHGKWLFISAIGTPIGDDGSLSTSNDFTGSLRIYKLHKKTDQWQLHQTIDKFTPGLEDLTPTTSFSATQPDQVQQQGAIFGFRFSVDLARGLLLVGAQNQQNRDAAGNSLINSGATYAFHLLSKSGEWKLDQKITNPEGAQPNDRFGSEIALYDDLALVSNGTFIQSPRLSAPAHPEIAVPNKITSSVYVYQFKNHTWKHVQTITGDQTEPTSLVPSAGIIGVFGSPINMGDSFGCSLALNQYWAIVGAGTELASPAGTPTFSGAAYIYLVNEKNGKKSLVRQDKIYSNDPTTQGTGSGFVSIQDNILLISDPLHKGPQGEVNQGAMLAYKFDGKRWKFSQTVFDPNGGAQFFFGFGLSQNAEYACGGSAVFITRRLFVNYGKPLIASPPFPLQNGHVTLLKKD